MAPLLTSVSLMATVMRPMLKAEPFSLQLNEQGGLGLPHWGCSSLFVKINEKVVAPYGKLSIAPSISISWLDLKIIPEWWGNLLS